MCTETARTRISINCIRCENHAAVNAHRCTDNANKPSLAQYKFIISSRSLGVRFYALTRKKFIIDRSTLGSVLVCRPEIWYHNLSKFFKFEICQEKLLVSPWIMVELF